MAEVVVAGESAAAEATVKNVKSAKRKSPAQNLQAIQVDVASFAASLGFSSGATGGISSGGFDDSDFRKKGPIRKGAKQISAAESHGGEDESEPGGGSKPKKKDRKDKKKKKKSEEFGADDSGDENEGKPRKGKKETSNGVAADGLSKGAKKGNKPEPGSSKIHEVLNAALGGTDVPTTKKRKGSWNKQQGDDDQGALSPKRSFFGSGDADSVRKLREEAQQLLDKAAQEYERSRQNNSDAQWLMQARRSGTSTDRVAAMTVILQDNPKANVRTLDALIGMLTSKAGKRHAATGIDALKELFMFNLLPDRKLKYFAQQPVESLPQNKERASTLMEWIWEDCLKHRYEKYVLALEEATKDTLSFLKEKALKTVYELLKSKPEQERRLLSTLVNKLGDPERKMASNASYLLSGLLTAHPNMKKVVVDEVEAFVFRPHVGLRARYYAAVFLNQIVLSNKGDGPKLAKQLIDLYFSLFKAVTSVVDEEDRDSKSKRKKGDKGRKRGFGKGMNKGSTNAKEKENAANFMMEIDSRLLSALLTGVNRALPYIKAEDLDTVTQENAVLFRLVHSTNFNVAVQALMLLHQLLTKSQAISDRFYRALYSVLLSNSLFKSSKAEMFLGLVYKSLKSDVDTRRISAFAKRLIQVAMHHPPQFACGSLLLLSEVLKAKPSLWNSVLQAEENDGEDEHFEDVKDLDSDGVENDADRQPLKPSETDVVWPKKGSYDPKHRDPLYCNAHRTCWWELSMLACHVHPSVAAMAHTLLSGANIVYNGDPLRDLALGVFLDRFAEKKPKALKGNQAGTWHGSSLTLPSRMGAFSSRPVGEEFSSLTEEQVAPEDLVFHKFYVTKSTLGKRKLKKKKKTDEDEDDITHGLLGSEAFEGDESEDEEVDVLLEKEADLEMDGGGGSDEEDEEAESEEEIELNEKDDVSGSDVDEEYDDSEDEEADALLEAGLEMSSDDDDDDIDVAREDGSLQTIEPMKSSHNTKSKKVKTSKVRVDGLSKPSKFKKSSKQDTYKVGSKNAGKISKLISGRNGKRSVFQEADSDDDI
ncbi:unnamed protein product [Calypogeia fissa]